MAMLRFANLISLCILTLLQPALAADFPEADEKIEESALEASIRIGQQMVLFNQQISALETEYGSYDQRLLEPLQGLTALLVEAGDFEEAGRKLNQRLHLLHILEGPSTLNQLRVITEKITNDIRLRKWESVTGSFEHIHLIHTQNPGVDASILLDALNDIWTWHLSAIFIDEPSNRIAHFRKSRKIQNDILVLLQKEFGNEREKMILWLYRIAVDQHRAATFLSSIDGIGNTVNRKSFGGEEYLQAGFDIVKHIQKIVGTMDNPEAQAMAMLYVADFQMLRRSRKTTSMIGGRVASRARSIADSFYINAMEMFKEAGIEEKRIAAFFRRPVVLPVTQYHLSLDEALAQQATYGYSVGSNTKNEVSPDNTVHMGDFIAWNESLPFARRPAIPELASKLNTELNTVQMRFTINSIGKARSPRTGQAEPNTVKARRGARNSINELQFRPSFVNGRWRRIRNVTLRYLYPPAK